MIDFICDGCHAALRIGDDSAGKLAQCPHCGTNNRVPGHQKRTSKLTIIARIYDRLSQSTARASIIFTTCVVFSPFDLTM